MQIYWSLSSLPELASLPKSERKRVGRFGLRKAFRHWQTWAALAVSGICGGAGGQLGTFIFSSSGMIFLCLVLCGGIGGVVYGHVATKMAMPYIREELSSGRVVAASLQSVSV